VRLAGVALLAGRDREAVRTVRADYLAIVADLASIEPVERILDETIHAGPGAPTLVSLCRHHPPRRPAAVSGRTGTTINVDLKTVFFLAQAFAKRAVRGRGAKIINVASSPAQAGGIRVPSYGREARRRRPTRRWRANGLPRAST
jgi:2-deoxy-D-gluconate 3-dehydrogenase